MKAPGNPTEGTYLEYPQNLIDSSTLLRKSRSPEARQFEAMVKRPDRWFQANKAFKESNGDLALRRLAAVVGSNFPGDVASQLAVSLWGEVDE